MRARLARLYRIAPLLLLTSSAGVRADDEQLVLMHESTPYTDVIDASDDADVFDLNTYIGYLRTIDSGIIQREQGGARSTVAESKQVRSQLQFGVDVGIYKDLMAFLRVPIVLGDERSIGVPDGRTLAQVAPLLQDPGDFAGREGGLFSLPLDSPARAGFDYVGVGTAISLTSQERRPWLPTWLLMIEGRRAVGKLMRPCRQDTEGKAVCGAENSEDLNGDGTPDGTLGRWKSSGASRGVSAINLETRVSKRLRYFEPYAGLAALIEWASSAKKHFDPGGLKGNIDTRPGRQFSATLGTEYIPWEHRARFQRVALDLRFFGTYFTRGRDYSVLFDALGTSGHAALARPNFEGVQGISPESGEPRVCSSADDVNCYVGRSASYYGLANLSSRLRYGGRLGLDIRAARYVRFQFGAGVSAVTTHALTSAEPCNHAFRDEARSAFASGQSCGARATNPNYRGTIDSPGRRFWMTSELIVELYASAIAQF